MAESRGDRVLAETKVAYADCQRYPPSEEDFAKRNLDWRAEEWLTLEELVPCLQVIGQYNLFRPKFIIGALEDTLPDAKFLPAREGSVALYIECSEDEAESLASQSERLQWDEYDYDQGVVRFWWD